MNIAIGDAMDSAKGVQRLPPSSLSTLPKFARSVVAYFVTPKLRKMSMQLASVCNNLKVCLLDVQRDSSDKLIDAELRMRDDLQALKEAMRTGRKEMADSYSDISLRLNELPELRRQIDILLALMDEVSEIASEMQWEIAEHDANFSRRLDGFQAANVDELTAMLQRIPAAK
jgi:hypothetical protein